MLVSRRCLCKGESGTEPLTCVVCANSVWCQTELNSGHPGNFTGNCLLWKIEAQTSSNRSAGTVAAVWKWRRNTHQDSVFPALLLSPCVSCFKPEKSYGSIHTKVTSSGTQRQVWTKNRSTTWELQVKFQVGKNEDCSLLPSTGKGGSIGKKIEEYGGLSWKMLFGLL